MSRWTEAIQDFLARKRIAVVGVSRDSSQAANFIFRKLREAGYEVVPVNPNAAQLEGVTCHPSLASIPGGVEAVVIATAPRTSAAVVRECAALGISRIWLHGGIGQGSVSKEALRVARELQLHPIPGACPAMFVSPVDGGHRCLRWFLKVTGGVSGDI